MIDIKLDHPYEIVSDKYQYILRKETIVQEGENKGKLRYEVIGYYGRLHNLLSAYKDMEMKTSNCTTMLELLSLAKMLDKKIEGLTNGN